ncbi:MAG: KH domain-containing protein [Candidatus Aenigmatarchaeota archaeon]
METVIRIPKKRISHVKNKKEELEERLEVEIKIGAEKADIEGESWPVWKCKDIIQAIGNGFSGREAFKLLKEENQLKIVKLKDHLHDRTELDRTKGRIIGHGGKTLKLIKKYTGASVSVYEDKVSIIGNPQEMAVASKAIEMFINGSPHANVYRYLEQNQPR